MTLLRGTQISGTVDTKSILNVSLYLFMLRIMLFFLSTLSHPTASHKWPQTACAEYRTRSNFYTGLKYRRFILSFLSRFVGQVMSDYVGRTRGASSNIKRDLVVQPLIHFHPRTITFLVKTLQKCLQKGALYAMMT
jgi:hypothetical protein